MFRQILEKMVNDVPGALSAVLMGNDGIAVEQFPAQSTDGQSLIVELGNTVKEIHHTTTVLAVGELQEITVQCEKVTFLLLMLNEEYFVAMLLDSPAAAGKGRYVMKRDAGRLRSALD
ncbi:MAG: roadblock/LC7 domain-containing protein [Desulfuromonadaceae bacterium]|nr:roadblock/LC7 domain-containing protein [Desulfuromonadaceae bacterium]